MPIPSFNGRRVLVLESRRQVEMAALVTSHGGRPVSAPAMREVPLDSNADARAALDQLHRGEVDVVIALTGVGLKAAIELGQSTVGEGLVEAALRRVRTVARGPKPATVLRSLGISPWVTAPEPNTWRELLGAIDATGRDAVRGQRVLIQEYGTPAPELLAGLDARGAHVTRMPIYRYGLPEDLEPLRAAVGALTGGDVEVALFTTATQATHLLQVANEQGAGPEMRAALAQVVVASIGPTTSDELARQGIAVDLEASHPKMGVLVREAAERVSVLLDAKRRAGQAPQ